jgi:hypothetical protein
MVLRGALALAVPITSLCLFAQFSTSDYVSRPQFWPTQTNHLRGDYAGGESCKDCHRQIFNLQQQTSMAHTAMHAGQSEILASHPRLSFSHGAYRYDILTANGVSSYTVADGKKTESAPLVWAFGTDRVAQSYFFKKKDGEFYESRVTYFQSLGTLDFTPGRALDKPLDVDEAMDRQVGRAEVYRCFGCHTTASGMESSFDEEKLTPGVSCEACHGPGRDHIADMEGIPPATREAKQETAVSDKILNPKRLTPEESVDFCGACHGSYWDVSLSNASGVGNARFQPYRLEQSKCWNKNDARLTCTACHDPHKQVETVATAYDHVCLSCHVTKGTKARPAAADATHPGAACPVARKECTSCHMPQVYVPAMHTSFPDHRIRIVRADEPFPD